MTQPKTTMFVRPRKFTDAERSALPGSASELTHVRVRIPGTGKVLDSPGEEVPMVAYWMRRLQDGSVERVDAAVEVDQPTKESPKRQRRSKN